MYELSDEGTIDFNHNPFSMPQGGMEALETKDPLDILAYQYDLVCNGYEMASGAVRNHNPEMVMLIEDSQNIREVIAFPKNKRARDLLMRAPSVVSEQQLKDVHIEVKK